MYKNKICGVYLITNNLNGMSYVGQSQNCMRRWNEHKNNSKNDLLIDCDIVIIFIEKYNYASHVKQHHPDWVLIEKDL